MGMEICPLKSGWLLCSLALSIVGTYAGQGSSDTTFSPYNAAALDSGSRLIIFPTDRKALSISLPLTLRYVTYAANGEALYASDSSGWTPRR